MPQSFRESLADNIMLYVFVENECINQKYQYEENANAGNHN